ncbi:MAG: hypothetical protein DLM67_13015 [Candidatus Nephthysia bennettiae]|nr:MAG: hypothetical protein DLM67_13015 [Candidatus Dormibacteraeota bacterium]
MLARVPQHPGKDTQVETRPITATRVGRSARTDSSQSITTVSSITVQVMTPSPPSLPLGGGLSGRDPTRADLLRRLGRNSEAAAAYDLAAVMAPMDAKRDFLRLGGRGPRGGAGVS